MVRRVKSSYRGINKLRRTLRRIETDTSGGQTRPLQRVIADKAGDILQQQQRDAPVRTGALARLLDRKISRDGFTARIGLVTKRAQRKGFYGWFAEVGTRGSAERGIPPQPASHFMARSFETHRADLIRLSRRAIDLILRRASRG